MSDDEIKIAEAASSPGQALPDSQPAGKKRTGLAWLNGFLLLFYGYGAGAIVVHGSLWPKALGIMLTVIVTGLILAAPCLFGFLAALNPKHELKRKLAKGSNLMAIGVALLTLLPDISRARTGFNGLTLAYGLMLSAFIALPAFLNLRAFWRPATAA